MIIFHDSIQEGVWFKSLNPSLTNAVLQPFPTQPVGVMKAILDFDRPDIILMNNEEIILVLERTVEVPSGHNVGQRFARLVGAAKARVPAVYFGPYAAYKHGGSTQGPRYMNLRLFKALRAVEKVERSALTTINWPVDKDYEIIQKPEKDTRIKQYLEFFFSLYGNYPINVISEMVLDSDFQSEQEAELQTFTKRSIKNPEQYNSPPGSVQIIPMSEASFVNDSLKTSFTSTDFLMYEVGMKKIRSDPYTGTALLYSYLYCGGLPNHSRPLVLYFPNITTGVWESTVARSPNRKDVRLFLLSADGILFKDGFKAVS